MYIFLSLCLQVRRWPLWKQAISRRYLITEPCVPPEVANAFKLKIGKIQSGTTIEIECTEKYEFHDGKSVQSVQCKNGVLNKKISSCVPSESMLFFW